MYPLYLSKNVDTPYPAPQGVDEQKYYAFVYRPKPRENLKAYTDRHDVVVAETDTGLVFTCVNSGVSAALPPVYGTVEKQTFADGTVLWRADTDNALMRFGDRIIRDLTASPPVLGSVWTASPGVMLANDGIDNGVTFVQVLAVPAYQDSFYLTNQVTITRADNKVEVMARTIIVPIKPTES